MRSLDIWFDLKVGIRNFAGTHDMVAAKESGKITIETAVPVTRINYPAIRNELHSLLDEAIDKIQRNQPDGVPYVK